MFCILINYIFEYPPLNWREATSTNYFVRQSVLTFVCPWQSKAWHDRLLELGLVMLFAPKESDFSLKIVSAVSTYILSLWTWTALFLFRFLGAKRPLHYLLPSVCMYIISNMTNSSLSEYCQAAFKCRYSAIFIRAAVNDQFSIIHILYTSLNICVKKSIIWQR